MSLPTESEWNSYFDDAWRFTIKEGDIGLLKAWRIEELWNAINTDKLSLNAFKTSYKKPYLAFIIDDSNFAAVIVWIVFLFFFLGTSPTARVWLNFGWILFYSVSLCLFDLQNYYDVYLLSLSYLNVETTW